MKLIVLIISLSGIGGIIFLEALALRAGIDGIALNAAIGAIAGIIGGLAGWLIPAPHKQRKDRK